MSDAPSAGHNLPDLASTLAPDAVAALIDIEKAPLEARAEALIASCKRFLAAYPRVISDEIDGKAAELLAVCARMTTKSGRVETARVAFKAPIAAADNAIGSMVRGPFANIIASINAAVEPIAKSSTAWKVAEDLRKRKAAQAEADRLAAEARMAEELATTGSKAVSLDDAVAAAQAAEKAQEAASVKPAELTRTHGDALGTTSLRYKRIVTIVEPAKVDRQYCVPDLSLLTRAAGKAGSPLPIIAGCSVADVPDLTVRR